MFQFFNVLLNEFLNLLNEKLVSHHKTDSCSVELDERLVSLNKTDSCGIELDEGLV